MNIFLETSTDGVLTFAATVIIAIAVAIGAGLRVFATIKDKKLNTESLEGLINSIYKDENMIALLKSVFTNDCFTKSNTYDEFIKNINEAVETKLYTYMKENATFIPESLLKYVTLDNMSYVATSILGYFGYDGKKLTEIFDDYLINIVINKEDEEVTEDNFEETNEEVIEESVEDYYEEKEATEEVVESNDNIELK